jgi:hypothetical protein
MPRPLKDRVKDALGLCGYIHPDEVQEVLDLLGKQELFEEYRMVLYCDHAKDNGTRRIYPLEQEKVQLIGENERLKDEVESLTRAVNGLLGDR